MDDDTERENLIAKIQQALDDGLAHPHQPNLVAIEGDLDLEELAEFVATAIWPREETIGGPPFFSGGIGTAGWPHGESTDD